LPPLHSIVPATIAALLSSIRQRPTSTQVHPPYQQHTSPSQGSANAKIKKTMPPRRRPGPKPKDPEVGPLSPRTRQRNRRERLKAEKVEHDVQLDTVPLVPANSSTGVADTELVGSHRLGPVQAQGPTKPSFRQSQLLSETPTAKTSTQKQTTYYCLCCRHCTAVDLGPQHTMLPEAEKSD
jgi:hypothetical protein